MLKRNLHFKNVFSSKKRARKPKKTDKKPVFEKKTQKNRIFFTKTFGDSIKSSTFALAKQKQQRLFFEILKTNNVNCGNSSVGRA